MKYRGYVLTQVSWETDGLFWDGHRWEPGPSETHQGTRVSDPDTGESLGVFESSREAQSFINRLVSKTPAERGLYIEHLDAFLNELERDVAQLEAALEQKRRTHSVTLYERREESRLHRGVKWR